MFETSPHNPFRPADWRWQRARWLLQSKKQARLGQDDTYTKAVKRYLSMKDKCKEDNDFISLEAKFPGIFWADEIRRTEGMDTRWAIEARILARQPLSDIAEKCNTTEETIVWYEKVFFNVLPHINKTDYITNVVMGQSVHSGLYERDYDLLWKLLGYALGPIFLESLILPVTNPIRVTDPKDINAAWADHNKGALARKAGYATLTMPVAYNQVNILQLYNDQVKIEREAQAAGGGVEAQIKNNIQSALICLPFMSGKTHAADMDNSTPRVHFQPKALSYYDSQGAELRADEMVQVMLGQEDQQVRQKVSSVKFPEVENAQISTRENQ